MRVLRVPLLLALVAVAALGGGASRSQVLCDPPCATLVRTPEELQSAPAAARPGTIIEIPGELTLDLDQVVPLELTSGVTLQSSRGGRRPGALLRVNRVRGDAALRVTGQGVTIETCGCRARGAARGRWRT